MNAAPPPLEFKRADWHARVQLVVFTWFAAAAVTGALRFEDWQWFLVHEILLGAVTNALFIWSWHFTGAILRVPDQADRGDELLRLLALNLGVVGTGLAVRMQAFPMILGSVGFLLIAVWLHGRALVEAERRALPSPYAFTVRVYVAACALLVPGLLLGLWLESLPDGDPMRPRLLLAHIACNLLGWVGLPILGTIVTLWPTMLRVRIASNAARLGRLALPMLLVAVVLTATAFLVDAPRLAAVGITLYLVGFAITLQPMLAVMRSKAPASFATWSALAGMVWLFAAVVAMGVRALACTDAAQLSKGLGWLALAAITGVLQVLLGCMSYLLPAMAAGGPAMVRLRNDRADRAMVVRFMLINAGAGAVFVFPGPGRAVAAALLGAGVVLSLLLAGWTLRTPSSAEIETAEAGRTWIDDREQRPYPFRRSGR